MTAFVGYAITFVGMDVNEFESKARANQKNQVCKLICETKENGKSYLTVGTGTVICSSSGKKAVFTAAHVVDKAETVRIEFIVKGNVISAKAYKIIKYPRYIDLGFVDSESLKTDFALVFCDIPSEINPIYIRPLDMAELVEKAGKNFSAAFIGYGNHGILSQNGFASFKDNGRTKRYMVCSVGLSPQTKLEIYANLLQESIGADIARQLRKTASDINSDEKVFFALRKELSKMGFKLKYNHKHIPKGVIFQTPPYRSRNIQTNCAGFTNPGDSGGPLFMGDTNNIIGVCVAGRPGDGKPHHFTRYQSFFNSYANYDVLQWIKINLDNA
jgi:hypothetical protein